MSSNESYFGVIIGVGSVGLRHLKSMLGRYETVLIIDPSSEARQKAELVAGSKGISFESVASAALSIKSEANRLTAVVSNWGPDHARTFNELADLGCKRFLIEKPLAHSSAAADQIASRVETESIRMVAGTSRRYSGFSKNLSAVFADVGDSPVHFVAHGGAMCVVTTGMHWVDLACAIYRNTPIEVVAALRDDRINPRSRELGYWSGTASWTFPESQTLTISYSSSSSVAGGVSIYGRNCRVDIDGRGLVSVGYRDTDEIKRDDRITRYGTVDSSEQLLLDSPDIVESAALLDLLDSDYALPTPPNELALIVKAMLAALQSSEEGRRISLPIDPEGDYYMREWPVS